jgi:hypothetical protein
MSKYLIDGRGNRSNPLNHRQFLSVQVFMLAAIYGECGVYAVNLQVNALRTVHAWWEVTGTSDMRCWGFMSETF